MSRVTGRFRWKWAGDPSSTRLRTPRQRGFTLAALMVIMSVMLIFIAFTVPKQWSLVMQRERELQTIYVMQQYAKAIDAFQKKNNTYPVSMSQLADARQPRFLRCPKDGCIDPLTGEVDWLLIPQSQARPPGTGIAPPGTLPPGLPGQTQTQTTATQQAAPAPGTTPTTNTPQQTTTAPPGIPMKDYAGGPFVGVRPNKNGSSLIIFNQQDHYEQWMYTALDYQADRLLRLQSAEKIWQ